MDNRQRAEMHRELAAVYDKYGGNTYAARDHREMADELDPPKPKYAPGTIAWCTVDGQAYLRVKHPGGRWSSQQKGTGAYTDSNYDSIEPIDVLPPNHLAVPFSHAWTPDYINSLCARSDDLDTKVVLKMVRNALLVKNA